MKIYSHYIPSTHINLAQTQLFAPEGISLDKVVEVVANQIASTIIHEAAHGKRWAIEYLSGNMSLDNMNRGTEENIAEQAEDKAGLSTELTPDIFDDSSEEESTDANSLLNQAISIANTKNDFYIPANSVENAKLSPEAWGQFNMVGGSDIDVSTANPSIAWDKYRRKLLIDVDSIVNEYNKAIAASQRMGRDRNMTQQTDGIQPDVPGVSQAQPLPQTDDNSVPGIGAIPSK